MSLLLLLVAAAAVQSGPSERSFEITYVAEVEAVEQEGGILSMWLPYPKRDDHQDVRLIGIDAPIATKIYQESLYRNSMLFLTSPLEAGATVRVAMSFRVTRREHVERDYVELEDPFGFVDASASRWLEPNRRIPSDESVAALAETLTADEESFVERERAIFDAIVREGVPAGLGTSPQDAFVALGRAAGVPMRYHAGFAIPVGGEEDGGEEEDGDEGEREVESGESWTEFYVPGFGWVPVDLLGALRAGDSADPSDFFGRLNPNRVELSLGRDVVLNPQQSGPPVDVFLEPYAEIDGTPVRASRRTLLYKELPDAP